MANDSSGNGKAPDKRVVEMARREQDLIGERLRRMYSDVVEEGVPDTFMDLLDQLEAAESKDDSQADSRRQSEQGPK